MTFKTFSLTLVGLTLAFSAGAQTKLESEQDKLSYALGMLIGERVLKRYDDLDYQILLEGMMAQHQGKETRLSMEDAGEGLIAYQQMLDEKRFGAIKAEGRAFLAENAAKDGVKETASGLQYSVIKAGTGKSPMASDNVTVHYRGTLLDGTEFDSSYGRGEPASFALDQVIPGWTEGMQLMNVGSKYKFVLPYQLAYGERGAGDSIGPYETLIFEVELLEVQPAATE